MKNKTRIGLILSIALLANCSWMGFNDEESSESEESGYTERGFYDKIQSNLKSKNWQVAISNLQLLESQFPFGKYAEQSQLELIYAQYMSSDYVSTIASAERFIRLHPQHPNVDYAIYVKGLSELNQSGRLFDGLFDLDNSKRDTGTGREAFATLGELIAKYPNSPYAPDARQRLISLRNLLARSEINVANYYFSRGALVAAANRGQFVVENFQQSPAVADGLAVMAQAYHMMGKDAFADNAVNVLAANFPDYPQLNEHGFDFDSRALFPSNWLLRKLPYSITAHVIPPAFDTRSQYNGLPK
ncbi:MAG: outer membrane protein assembly factor BamD [Porticoccaceae bacterium]|nr:outer membrane protein assembly factor BamD [Porticoccaceae bacterium]